MVSLSPSWLALGGEAEVSSEVNGTVVALADSNVSDELVEDGVAYSLSCAEAVGLRPIVLYLESVGV